MKLNEVRPAPGAVRERKRIGRGPGSGRGGTAGKGHKGEQARSGSPKRKAFEGGQVRITRRLPKFGFKSPFRIEYQVVNVNRLQQRFVDGDSVDIESLIARGLLSKRFEPVKVLGEGDLSKKLSVRVDAVSATARQKIEAAGGQVEIVETGKLAKRAGVRQQAAAKATA